MYISSLMFSPLGKCLSSSKSLFSGWIKQWTALDKCGKRLGGTLMVTPDDSCWRRRFYQRDLFRDQPILRYIVIRLLHDCSRHNVCHNWEPSLDIWLLCAYLLSMTAVAITGSQTVFFTTQWSINQIQSVSIAASCSKDGQVKDDCMVQQRNYRPCHYQPHPTGQITWPSWDARGMALGPEDQCRQVCQALVGVLEKGLGTVSSRGAVRSDGHGDGCDGIRLIYRNRQCISACIYSAIYILHPTVPFTLSRRRIAISIAFPIDVHCHTLFDMFIDVLYTDRCLHTSTHTRLCHIGLTTWLHFCCQP